MKPRRITALATIALFNPLLVATALAQPGSLPTAFGEPTPDSPGGEVTVITFDLFCDSTVAEARDAFSDGTAASDRGEFDLAIAHYRRAIELDDTFCDAMDNLGQLRRQAGDLTEAISWYQRSIGLNSENPVARINLAGALMLSGDLPGAIAEYEEVIRIDPMDPEGFYGLGYLYLDSGDPANAIVYLGLAEGLYRAAGSPYTADAQLLLAWAHSNQGNCDEARAYIAALPSEFAGHPVFNEVRAACP